MTPPEFLLAALGTCAGYYAVQYMKARSLACPDLEIKVSAELPGMDEKDIDVSLTRDTLTIKGEKKEEKEDTGKDYYKMERSYGSFTRSIPLPVEVDTDKVQATFKKGVLEITLPKTAKAIQETKKVPVKAK